MCGGGSVEHGLDYFFPQLLRSVQNIISNLSFVRIDKGAHIRTVLQLLGEKHPVCCKRSFDFWFP